MKYLYLLYLTFFVSCASVTNQFLKEHKVVSALVTIGEAARMECSLSYNFEDSESFIECSNYSMTDSCRKEIIRYNRPIFEELAKQVIKRRKRSYCYDNLDAHNLFVTIKTATKKYSFDITGLPPDELEKYKVLRKINPIFAIVYQKMSCYECEIKR